VQRTHLSEISVQCRYIILYACRKSDKKYMKKIVIRVVVTIKIMCAHYNMMFSILYTKLQRKEWKWGRRKNAPVDTRVYDLII